MSTLHSSSKQIADQFGDLQRFNRFRDVGVVAGIECPDAILGTGVSGQCYRRGRVARCVTLPAANVHYEVVAVAFGHADVRDDHLRVPSFYFFERFVRGRSFLDGGLAAFECDLENFARVRFIVDHEYANATEFRVFGLGLVRFVQKKCFRFG